MNPEAFTKAYNESRNGANHMCRNPLYPTFLYSDGVKECADAGCHWLLDILGTELPGAFKSRPSEYMCIVSVQVSQTHARIVGEFHDNDKTPYAKHIDYTDMPEGKWTFYVSREGHGLTCILPSEY